jgi:uncharacterized protein (TIGR02594 family)
MQPPANAPAWLKAAWEEIGTHELPNNRGPAIKRYIALADAGNEGDPWCAIFANAMLEKCGINGTRSASSQSFRHSREFVKLSGPAIGAIAVFWRISRTSGFGHVGFYCGERGPYVWTLGGNEADMVQIEMLAKDASTFGLVGFYWPRAAPLPQVAPVIVDASIPNHLTKVV